MEEYDSPFDKKPFERKHLDTKDDILSIRLNDEERVRLKQLKDILQYDSDGRVLKDALIVMQNVVSGTFGEKLMRYISSQRRVKASPSITQN